MAEHILGVISDTHSLLRPEAISALAGVEHIIHAGDVGSAEVLAALGRIAPVTAVRGNVDKGDWASTLPTTEVVDVEGCLLYILHDLATLDLNPEAAGMAAVIYGHSHQPLVERHQDVLFLNPGSAGPRRFKLPLTLARLTVREKTLDAELIELNV